MLQQGSCHRIRYVHHMGVYGYTSYILAESYSCVSQRCIHGGRRIFIMGVGFPGTLPACWRFIKYKLGNLAVFEFLRIFEAQIMSEEIYKVKISR